MRGIFARSQWRDLAVAVTSQRVTSPGRLTGCQRWTRLFLGSPLHIGHATGGDEQPDLQKDEMLYMLPQADRGQICYYCEEGKFKPKRSGVNCKGRD